MTIRLRKSFEKDFKKLDKMQRISWKFCFRTFEKNPINRKLRRHKTKGKFHGLESIDVTPDLRALFKQKDDLVIFYYIRNHNQLYS